MVKQSVKHTFSWIAFASKAEKAEMQSWVEDENNFQKIEPQGLDDDNKEFAIVYKLERHSSWQMTAYTPSGIIMDNSYHEGFCRCNNCKKLFIFNNGADASNDNQYCYECKTEFTNGNWYYPKRNKRR
jgi:hypothetical protein